jgi:hypothetical protein
MCNISDPNRFFVEFLSEKKEERNMRQERCKMHEIKEGCGHGNTFGKIQLCHFQPNPSNTHRLAVGYPQAVEQDSLNH